MSVKVLQIFFVCVGCFTITSNALAQKTFSVVEKFNDPRLPKELVTHYVIPKGSPFDLLEKPTETDGVVTFLGVGQIEGEFVVKWLYIDDDEAAKIAVEFVPNRASSYILPFVEDTMVRPVKAISFSNSDFAIKALLSGRQFRQLKNRSVLSVTGAAKIEIRGYSTGGDCDHRWYEAHFVKVIRIKPIQTAQSGTFPCGS